MYCIFYGEIPDRMVVMHICDNPSCCNPKHLKMGTQQENVQDCIDKKRRSPQNCDNNNRRVLNSEKVLEIKDLYESGKYTIKAIADRYSVGRSTISYIIKGKSWAEVTNGVVVPENRVAATKANLSKKQVLGIKNLLKTTDLTFTEIADKYNITHSEVSLIARNKMWKNIGEKVDIDGRKTHTVGTKFSKEEILKIKELLKLGELSIKKISQKFNISTTHLHFIKTGKSWSDVGCNNFEIRIGKKLNSKKVLEIKKILLDESMSVKEIAEKFDVCTKNIYNIKNEEIWKDIIL